MGDYVIRISTVDTNATQELLDFNPNHEPPIPGYQFVLVGMEVQYIGSHIGKVTDLQFSVVGSGGVGYLEEETLNCGLSPQSQNLSGDIFAGGIIEHFRCWSVPTDEANSLIMYGGPTSTDQPPTFFALNEELISATPSGVATPAVAIETKATPIVSPAASATIELQAQDVATWSLSELEVVPGQEIQVTNVGVLEHNFTVDELGVAESLSPGDSVEVSIPEDAAIGDTYFFYCSEPGHRDLGMEGTITIVEPDLVNTDGVEPAENEGIGTPLPTGMSTDASPVASPGLATPLYATPLSATPMPGSPVEGASGLLSTGDVIRTEASTRVHWGVDAEPLSGVAGFVPVSFTFTDDDAYGSPYVFIELKNISGGARYAPFVEVELFQGEFSFGAQWVGSAKNWIEADGSAYFQTSEFYSGSIGNSDWDGLDIVLGAPRVRESAEGIRIEGDRLYNDRSEPLPPTLLAVAMFDGDGVFIGACSGGGTPETGANTPPGGSLALSESIDPTYEPSCGFSDAGKFASLDLGVGGPFTTEYWVGYFIE